MLLLEVFKLSDFKSIVKESLKEHIGHTKTALKEYSDSDKYLTRRHWTNDHSQGEVARLAIKFGQNKVDKWNQENTLRDQVGG